MSVEWWQDGEKGWRVESDDLADITLAAQAICKEMGVAYDPSSVLVFADYDGNIRLNLRGIHWTYDAKKDVFEVDTEGLIPHKISN